MQVPGLQHSLLSAWHSTLPGLPDAFVLVASVVEAQPGLVPELFCPLSPMRGVPFHTVSPRVNREPMLLLLVPIHSYLQAFAKLAVPRASYPLSVGLVDKEPVLPGYESGVVHR